MLSLTVNNENNEHLDSQRVVGSDMQIVKVGVKHTNIVSLELIQLHLFEILIKVDSTFSNSFTRNRR